MKTGTTTDGFSFTFDERNADDMRFVDLIAYAAAEDTPEFEKLAAASRMIEMLIGSPEREKFGAWES